MNKLSIKLNLFNFFKIVTSLQFILIFCLYCNAQQTEKFVRKLADGTEVYQRRSETVSDLEQSNTLFGNESGSEKPQLISQKLEAVLKTPGSNQEIIIWSDTHSFSDGRAFNFFLISDVYKKNDRYYLIYYKRLEVRVITAFEDSGIWRFENDTFLQDTSESHNPIIEAKFIGKKPTIFAKRYYGGLQELIYEWKLKKGKWVLTKEREIKNKLPRWAKK